MYTRAYEKIEVQQQSAYLVVMHNSWHISIWGAKSSRKSYSACIDQQGIFGGARQYYRFFCVAVGPFKSPENWEIWCSLRGARLLFNAAATAADIADS